MYEFYHCRAVWLSVPGLERWTFLFLSVRDVIKTRTKTEPQLCVVRSSADARETFARPRERHQHGSVADRENRTEVL